MDAVFEDGEEVEGEDTSAEPRSVQVSLLGKVFRLTARSPPGDGRGIR